MPRMIHVLRKPLSEGTVVSNVLKHGTGGLNIDASRISFRSEADERESKAKNQHGDFGTTSHAVLYGDYSGVPHKNYTATGRWPANVILQHLDGCRCDGVKRVKAAQGGRNPVRRTAIHGEYGGHQSVGRGQSYCDYADKDGKETVANWICGPGCPVARLEMISTSTTGVRVNKTREQQSPVNTPFTRGKEAPEYTDSGGASRFYKQVGGTKVPE